jgi:uncharacterized repeat protein (TIGR03803 family)
MFPNIARASDGYFYGSSIPCYCDAALGTSEFYRVSSSGVETPIYTFDAAGPSSLSGPVLEGSDGNFYGASDTSILRITPSGTVTILYTATYACDHYVCTNSIFASVQWSAAFGNGGLIEGTDGNFYGTAPYGGADFLYPRGSVFRISPSGAFTNLYSFSHDENGNVSTDGALPYAPLLQGADGNFYGMTSQGGNTNLADGNGYGTIFRITPTGTLTTLYAFSGPDGAYGGLGSGGLGGLVQGSDGNFYGTTPNGGSDFGYYGGGGTVFRITPSGTLTTLWSTGGGNCGHPYYGVVQGSDGSFYGTVACSIFKLTVPLNPPPNQVTAIQVVGTNTLVTFSSIAGESYQLQYSPAMVPTNWSDVAGASISKAPGAAITLTDIGGAVYTQRFYRVVSTCPTGSISDPMGYMTLTAEGTNGPANYPYPALSFWGLGLTQIPADRGTITSVSGTAVGIGNLTADQYDTGPSGPLYYIEDTSTNSPFAGFTDDIVGNDTNTVWTDHNDSSIFAAGDTFKIYPHWTLGSLFGTNDSAGLKPNSDQILVQNPVTKNFSTYLYEAASKTVTAGWKNGANGSDASNVPLYQNQGLLFQRSVATNLNYQLVGAVKLRPTIVPLCGATNSSSGNNFVANVYAGSSVTLSNSGLYTDGSSTDSLVAVEDHVEIHNDSTGNLAIYYYVTAGKARTAGWKNASNGSDANNVTIPQGANILIQLQTGHNGFNWREPAPY